MKRSIHDNYAVIIHGTDGKDYSLIWNGGIGGTDTNEWSDHNGIGILFSEQGAMEVASNPHQGYRPTPEGTLVVYKIVLEKVDSILSRTEAENLLNRARIALELMSPIKAKEEDPVAVLHEYLRILSESLSRLKSSPLAYNEGLALKEQYMTAYDYFVNNEE